MAPALSVFAAVLSILLMGCGNTSDPNTDPNSAAEQVSATDRTVHLDFHRGKLPAESTDATALGVRSTTPLEHPRVGQPGGSRASGSSDRGSTTP